MSVHTIKQGEDCIIWVRGIVGDLDPAGCSVHAMARPSPTSPTLWQEWATDPTGTQGTARIVGQEVALDVTHAMSSAWTWAGRTGVLHVEITETGGQQRRARVGDDEIYLDPEAVRP